MKLSGNALLEKQIVEAVRSGFKFGVEIESTIAGNPWSFISNLFGVDNNSVFRAGYDGSVRARKGRAKAEFVTGIIDSTNVYQFFTEIQWFIPNVRVNATCGGHIHVSHTSDSLFLTTMASGSTRYAEIADYKPEPHVLNECRAEILALYPDREGNGYADSKRIKWGLVDGGSKYANINVGGSAKPTVEFRLFGARNTYKAYLRDLLLSFKLYSKLADSGKWYRFGG